MSGKRRLQPSDERKQQALPPRWRRGQIDPKQAFASWTVREQGLCSCASSRRKLRRSFTASPPSVGDNACSASIRRSKCPY